MTKPNIHLSLCTTSHACSPNKRWEQRWDHTMGIKWQVIRGKSPQIWTHYIFNPKKARIASAVSPLISSRASPHPPSVSRLLYGNIPGFSLTVSSRYNAWCAALNNTTWHHLHGLQLYAYILHVLYCSTDCSRWVGIFSKGIFTEVFARCDQLHVFLQGWIAWIMKFIVLTTHLVK